MAEILLEADHVGLAYHELDGETLAVEDISFAVEKGEFLFCFTENINKIKNRQEWFQSDLEEEYLHEIYPLYSPGEEDDEYEDEDGEKCSIMRNNV